MTGLHTLGYRPKPGERVNLSNGGTDTRRWWVLSWRYRREHPADRLLDVFDKIADACLAARDAVYPDALFEAYVARQDARRAARAS